LLGLRGRAPRDAGALARRVSRRRCGAHVREWRGHELAVRDPRLRPRPGRDLLGELGVRAGPARRQGLRGRIPRTRVGAYGQLSRVDDARRRVTPDELGAWLDEHQITTVRTEGPSLDGVVLGKHLSRDKFERSLPLGPALSDLVFAWDIGGSPQLGWWADFRQPALGDVHQRPDLSTIVASPNRPGLANVLVEHATIDGTPLPVCARVVLRGVVDKLAARGFTAIGACELEFMLFRESYEVARRA